MQKNAPLDAPAELTATTPAPEADEPSSPDAALADADPTADAEAPPVAVPKVVPLTAEEIEQLKTRAAKSDQLYDQLLRKAADFENFKKRAACERTEATKYANEALLQKLIPVLDNFDMALAATTNADTTTVQSLQTGINMICQQLKATLTEAGLEEIDAANKPFDPNLHEAVSQEETADVPEGQVVQQLRKGYKLRDRLLRPASVVVASKPAA